MVLNYCATSYIGWPLPAFIIMMQRYKKYLKLPNNLVIILLQNAKFFSPHIYPLFYEAFQHFFDGFPKSVTRLRSKNFLLSFLNGLRGLYLVGIQQIKFFNLGFPPLFFINLFFYMRYLESL